MRIRVILAAAALFITGVAFADPTPSLDVNGGKPVIGTAWANVTCDVKAGPEGIKSGTLVFTAPAGFSIDQQTMTIPGVSANATASRTAHLHANDSKQPDGKLTVKVELSSTSTSESPVVVGTKESAFTYQNGCQPLAWYLVYGLAGALIGYVIRLIVALLQGTTPPQVAALLGVSLSKEEKHHYLLDGALTLILSFIVLVYLISGGRPPDSACTWYGAIVGGVALGFLSNAQLMSKISIPSGLLVAIGRLKGENQTLSDHLKRLTERGGGGV